MNSFAIFAFAWLTCLANFGAVQGTLHHNHNRGGGKSNSGSSGHSSGSGGYRSGGHSSGSSTKYKEIGFSAICDSYDGCLCDARICKINHGCLSGNGGNCVGDRIDQGEQCANEKGCMCGGTSKNFVLACPKNTWCQSLNGHTLCENFLIKTGDQCKAEKCACYKTDEKKLNFDKTCKQGMTCHVLGSSPACAFGIIGFGAVCSVDKCICEQKNGNVVTLSASLGKNQRCELIQDNVSVVNTVIGLAATCQNDKCACIDNNQKLGAVCHKDQVCSKLADQDQLTCVTQTIKENETCNNKFGDECVCQASPGAIAATAKKWIRVSNGMTCIVLKNELSQSSDSMAPNKICQNTKGKCLCKSVINPADQILCDNKQICAEFSTGLQCVADEKHIFSKAAQEMVCQSADNQIIVCKKDEICARNDNGQPFCLKTVINDGEKCTDSKTCVCTTKVTQAGTDPKISLTYIPFSTICAQNESCGEHHSGTFTFCVGEHAQVLLNGQNDVFDNYFCSNQGFADGHPKQTACPSGSYCIIEGDDPFCVDKSLMVWHTAICWRSQGCLCASEYADKDGAVFCNENQQCLTNEPGPRCVGPTLTHNTECTLEEGCPCYAHSDLNVNKVIETIFCKKGQYCSADYDGPLCVTPKLASDKSAQQMAMTVNGVTCAFRKDANSPVFFKQCPQFFACAWADEGGAICESSTTKIALVHNQICTNIVVGCVCVIQKTTKNCMAGEWCKSVNGEAVCSGDSYNYFEVPKGHSAECGLLGRRDKSKVQYCKTSGISMFDTDRPNSHVFFFNDLMDWAISYSRNKRYFQYDPNHKGRSNRRLSALVKI